MLARLSLALLATTTPLHAQDAQDVAAGYDIYRSYCIQCHGIDARGDGPMAELLAIDTPDLTILSINNGDSFPAEAVAFKIDGRTSLMAHGGEMPIFGEFFESDQAVAITLETGQPMLVSEPLAQIMAYLQSIQR